MNGIGAGRGGFDTNMFKQRASHAALESDLGNFDEDDTRAGFVRKVFGIITAQLTITAIFVVIAMQNSKNLIFMGILKDPTIAVLMVITYIACNCALICCNLHR